MLGDRGLWIDFPLIGDEFSAVTSVTGPAASSPSETNVIPHLPLPDEYVAEMGRNSLWIIQQLGPPLLRLSTQIRDLWLHSEDVSVTPSRVAQRRSVALNTLLRRHRWIDASGNRINVPPFKLRSNTLGKGGSLIEEDTDFSDSESELVYGIPRWHPTCLSHVIHLLKLLQMAHFFVVGLSMGSRKSEIVTLQRGCIQYSINGLPYASGRTWKLVDRHEGERREWVLPDVAMHAVEQQAKLVSIIDDIGPIAPLRGRNLRHDGQNRTHLWAEIGGGKCNRTAPLMQPRSHLRAYATELGMTPDPGGQSIRVHRFRKTIARLVALAITEAPKVLKDVFGHKSIEMTLYYILTDKDLQVDVERVSRELRIMRATETVEAMVAAEELISAPMLGGFGGPAAPKVWHAIEMYRGRLHKRGDEWGAETAFELAEILTLQGKSWQFVRPGIICTKFPGTEAGPCNKSKGAPEPARCQSHCTYRLEESFLRADVEGAIDEALLAYQSAMEEGDDMLQALWADQVRIHIGRFPDLRLQRMSDTRVRSILEHSSTESHE